MPRSVPLQDRYHIISSPSLLLWENFSDCQGGRHNLNHELPLTLSLFGYNSTILHSLSPCSLLRERADPEVSISLKHDVLALLPMQTSVSVLPHSPVALITRRQPHLALASHSTPRHRTSAYKLLYRRTPSVFLRYCTERAWAPAISAGGRTHHAEATMQNRLRHFSTSS